MSGESDPYCVEPHVLAIAIEQCEADLEREIGRFTLPQRIAVTRALDHLVADVRSRLKEADPW